MKFKILLAVPLVSTILFSQTGGDIFDKNCAKCHVSVIGITNDGVDDNDYVRLAPYIVDLVKELKSKTATKEEFSKFIREYIENPDKRKTIYGKKAIRKFGLMPPLKGVLSEDEKSLLIDYLYDEKYSQKAIKVEKNIHKDDPRMKIFEKNCASCHAAILGIENDGGYNNSYITAAPYIVDLVKELKSKTATKEEFSNFIREYIKNPDKRKTLYGKKAIKKFGLMPSLKGKISEEDITQLVDFLYDNF